MKIFLSENNVPKIESPAWIPDINPIKNKWCILKNMVFKLQIKSKTKRLHMKSKTANYTNKCHDLAKSPDRIKMIIKVEIQSTDHIFSRNISNFFSVRT